MRRNLVLRMRGLLVGDIKPPPEQQLRDYFDVNREKFTRPATLSRCCSSTWV